MNSMSDKRIFLDTNVLVYLFDNDETQKQAIAEKLFRENGSIFISTQVLQEFYVAVTRKLTHPLDTEAAWEAVQSFMTYSIETIDPKQVSSAIRRSIESKLSFWDALIVETALKTKADILYTEDLQHKWRIGKMQVLNPFYVKT